LKQEVLNGVNQLPYLTKYLISNKICRILLVRGKDSYRNSSAKSTLEAHLETFEVTEHSEFSHNPKIEDVIRGIHIFNGNECEAIIAVGGGSVIDMAKLIKAYQDSQGDISSEVNNNIVGSCDTKLIALPTTAGSGSEATQFAVVYIYQKKFSVSHEKLRPDLAFLISDFTHSADSYLSASTGMDAMSQSIESFWSVNSTKESREYSREALQSLLKFLSRAVLENDVVAKSKVMMAAHLAGKAINIAKTTAAHAISYSFTSYHGIPHGHAVALTLPFFCGYNSQISSEECNDERGTGHVRGIFSEIQDIFGEDNIEKALTTFISDLGLNLTIPESSNGIEKDVDRILGNINAQRMKNNPRTVQIHDLRSMLKKIILSD
jgi:alcohol dehydrogenase